MAVIPFCFLSTLGTTGGGKGGVEVHGPCRSATSAASRRNTVRRTISLPLVTPRGGTPLTLAVSHSSDRNDKIFKCGRTVNVIIETCVLADEEWLRRCRVHTTGLLHATGMKSQHIHISRPTGDGPSTAIEARHRVKDACSIHAPNPHPHHP